MGKMSTHQHAHGGLSSVSPGSSGTAASPPSQAARGPKLPTSSSTATASSTQALAKAHHHAQYKTDVGRFVYYFLREHPPARLVRKQPCQPRQLVHRLATPGSSSSASASSSSSEETMPRRKSTKKIIVNASPSNSDDGKEPHSVFKANGSPIISPRLIRNSLRDSKLDLDGDTLGRHDSPETSVDDASARTDDKSLDQKRKVARMTSARGEDAMVAAQAAREAELAKNLEAEKALTGLSGVQLWVHRLLMAHNQTLNALGVDRKAFPNARLSLKQTETVISPIVALCDVMRADHFGIHVPTPQIARTMSDVHYWKLWESDTIDIGIFFMPPNSVIPLHNHPGMSVVTRVLYGSANVTSFDLISEPSNSGEASEESTSMTAAAEKGNMKWARVARQGEVGTESTLWLDPRRFNLHQIQANGTNGCALLDIMVPPYDNANRDCHHFKILEEKIMSDQRIVKMIESVMPDNHNAPSDHSTASSSPGSS